MTEAEYRMEILRLKEENRSIRGNSVSMEVYQQALEERDAAIGDLENIGADKARDYQNQTFTSPCRYCKKDDICDYIPTDNGCCFKWRGTQKEDGDCDL